MRIVRSRVILSVTVEAL